MLIQSSQIHWLRVGELVGDREERVNGFVWQADTSGIKAAWEAVDPQSGIKEYLVAVGTRKGDYSISRLMQLIIFIFIQRIRNILERATYQN